MRASRVGTGASQQPWASVRGRETLRRPQLGRRHEDPLLVRRCRWTSRWGESTTAISECREWDY